MSNISDKSGSDKSGSGTTGSGTTGSDAEGRRDMEDVEIMDERHARLVARALGELDDADLAVVEAELAASPEARAELARIQATLGLVEEALRDSPRLSDASRAATFAAARPAHLVPWWRKKGVAVAAGVAALAGGALGWLHIFQQGAAELESGPLVASRSQESVVVERRVGFTRDSQGLDLAGSGGVHDGADAQASWAKTEVLHFAPAAQASTPPVAGAEVAPTSVKPGLPGQSSDAKGGLPAIASAAPNGPVDAGAVGVGGGGGGSPQTVLGVDAGAFGGRKAQSRAASGTAPSARPTGGGASSSGPSSAGPAGGATGAEIADRERLRLGGGPATTNPASGVEPAEEAAKQRRQGDVFGAGSPVLDDLDGVVAEAEAPSREEQVEAEFQRLLAGCQPWPGELPRDMYFRFWGDNPFEVSLLDKQSTFGVDVDTASYALARRYINEGRLPEKAQVRTEEFVNYFKAESAPPTSGPFAIHVELAPSRFGGDQARQMLRVVVRAKDLAHFERKPLRLTFVVDVSGSMREQNRLETVKDSLRLLVAQLEPGDRVAIVKYSTEASLVAPMASVSDKVGFETAIQSLAPNGGTNSNAGLQLGYAVAVEALDPACVNRVVFLSDGVANQGVVDPREIAQGLAPLKEKGILLNTIGVGMNNHNDALLEQLADTCDGVCTYVDTPKEARRALVDNFTGMFQPVGRDAKVQVEFDPGQVRRWRQLGYENRAIADADFRNDKVDAGEINAGHEMTALYELEMATPRADAPLAVVRLRWKEPRVAGGPAEDEAAREMEAPVAWSRRVGFAGASHGYRRAAIVAQYAEFLRRSTHAQGDRVEDLLAEARALRAERAQDGEWAEFVGIVEKAAALGLGADVGCDELCDVEERLRRAHWRRHEGERLKQSGAALEVDDHEQDIERLRRELRRLLEERVQGR
jgi:Ca-activated chloride channel family protein